MASSSELQGAGINQNQLPASSLGGSTTNLQSQSATAALQGETTGSVEVVGDKGEGFKDTSYVNVIILVVIAVVAVAGVIMWFRDAD